MLFRMPVGDRDIMDVFCRSMPLLSFGTHTTTPHMHTQSHASWMHIDAHIDAHT